MVFKSVQMGSLLILSFPGAAPENPSNLGVSMDAHVKNLFERPREKISSSKFRKIFPKKISKSSQIFIFMELQSNRFKIYIKTFSAFIFFNSFKIQSSENSFFIEGTACKPCLAHDSLLT